MTTRRFEDEEKTMSINNMPIYTQLLEKAKQNPVLEGKTVCFALNKLDRNRNEQDLINIQALVYHHYYTSGQESKDTKKGAPPLPYGGGSISNKIGVHNWWNNLPSDLQMVIVQYLRELCGE